MTRQFHGISSLLLMVFAISIAAFKAFQVSAILGLVYLVACGGAFSAIIYGYCAKCPCKGDCAHVFLGMMAMRVERRVAPYTRIELIVLLLALSCLIGLPQLWLWRFSTHLMAFWILNAIAFVQIRLVSCRTCGNQHCPLRIEISEMEN